MGQSSCRLDGQVGPLRGRGAWHEASVTRLSQSGEDLGQRKSKTPEVETSLACCGNGKKAGGETVAHDIVGEDWVSNQVEL